MQICEGDEIKWQSSNFVILWKHKNQLLNIDEGKNGFHHCLGTFCTDFNAGKNYWVT
jgi:hypothetical protein